MLFRSIRDSNSSDKYGQIIREAKDYIGEHFGNSEFSLNRIAEYIGMSPSYFSSIFKQGTGQTLVEYLTRVRIDKACELLKCTNLRAAEIGEQVREVNVRQCLKQHIYVNRFRQMRIHSRFMRFSDVFFIRIRRHRQNRNRLCIRTV